MTETYFGHPDASQEAEATIRPNHVTRAFEAHLKIGTRPDGKHIVVGIKGSGKTALRRYIEQSEPAIVWNLDADNAGLGVEVESLGAQSGVLKNSLALELLRSFVGFLHEKADALGLPKSTAIQLKRAGDAVLDTLKNIPRAIDINTPLGQVKLSELLKSRAAPFVKAAWRDLSAKTLTALGTRRAYIMIDDAEDVFPGMEKDAKFIEGLARAVHDINLEYKEHLHVLLFLKYGIWRRWYEDPQEYDKVESAIQDISWDHAALCMVLARRIATARELQLPDGKLLDVQGLWALEFDWQEHTTFEELTRELTKYCVSGPRDMVALANMAKKAAGQTKITREHIQEVLKKYSETKVNAINADFGVVYPDAHRFVERVFQGCPVEMTGREVAEWIDQHAMTDDRVDPEFNKLPWYSASSKERLMKLMYDVGLLGKKTADGESVYAIEAPTETVSELLDSVLTVHPAFRPHLGIGAKTVQAKASRQKKHAR